jgi:hypothetical protein
MAVYIDHRERSGTMTLFNPGSRPEEVQIEFAFGYPQSDENGNVVVPLTDEPAFGEPSALEWITAFPRRLRLEPGQRQVVRLVARPPAGLVDGEYWARALVRAKGGQPPIESIAEDGVAVQIDLETVIVIPVNYRNGSIRTGLQLQSVSASIEGDSVVTSVHVSRTGNAAFLGRVLVELLDADGNPVGSREEVLAVYRTIERRLALPLPPGAGAVAARFTMDTNRDDLPPGGALPAEPVVASVAIR